jgi:hypothetical protein
MELSGVHQQHANYRADLLPVPELVRSCLPLKFCHNSTHYGHIKKFIPNRRFSEIDFYH